MAPSRHSRPGSWQPPSWTPLSRPSVLTQSPSAGQLPVDNQRERRFHRGRNVVICKGTAVVMHWNCRTYSTNSHPDSNIAEDDDSEGQEAASNHQDYHVGLDSGVITSTEHVWSTGCLQSMRPVPVNDMQNTRGYTHIYSMLQRCYSVVFNTIHNPIKDQLKVSYRLQPKTGGAHQTAAQTHEKTMPPVAHLASNLTFPKGLQTTTHLSQEMTVRDHRAAIPDGLSSIIITICIRTVMVSSFFRAKIAFWKRFYCRPVLTVFYQDLVACVCFQQYNRNSLVQQAVLCVQMMIIVSYHR